MPWGRPPWVGEGRGEPLAYLSGCLLHLRPQEALSAAQFLHLLGSPLRLLLQLPFGLEPGQAGRVRPCRAGPPGPAVPPRARAALPAHLGGLRQPPGQGLLLCAAFFDLLLGLAGLQLQLHDPLQRHQERG